MAVRIVLCAFLAAGCARTIRPADRDFLALESAHFRLRTDLSEADAREALVELEQVRMAFLAAFWKGKIPSPGKVGVVLFADQREMRDFARPGMGGFWAHDALGSRLLVTSDRLPTQYAVLKHELAHDLSDRLLPEETPWLAEGIACYLETLRRDGGTFILGEPDPTRVMALQRHPVGDWNWVLHGGSAYVSERRGGWAFESVSWLLVHWLVNLHRPELEQYLFHLGTGEDAIDAWHATFPGMSDNDLSGQLEAYSRYGSWVQLSFAAPRYRGPIRVRSMRKAEVHAVLADLIWISSGLNRDLVKDARAEAGRSLALDPGEPEALAVLARLGEPGAPGEPGSVIPLDALRQAAKAHAEDARAFMVLADALLRVPKHDREELRNAADRALALAPDEARAFSLAAEAALEDGRPRDAAHLAEMASWLSPRDLSGLDLWARALLADGDCPGALGVRRRAAARLPENAPRTFVEKWRRRLADIKARCPTREEELTDANGSLDTDAGR